MKVSLGDVCKILNGYAFKSENYTSSGIRVVRIANVQKGYIEDNTPQFYPLSEIDTIKPYLLYEGDILLSLTGNVGRVAVLEKQFLPAALNQRVACLRPLANTLTPRYLFYSLLSAKFEADCINSSKGIAQKNMSTEWLKQYSITIRNIEEQTKITTRLDLLSRIISHRRAQLDKLDELVKCLFVELFGDCRSNPKQWDTKKLEEIASVGSSKRVFVEELIDEGIPFYRGTEVGALAEGLNITPELFISESHYQALCEASGKPVKGDLLMPSICPDGRIWIVDSDSPFYFKDGRVLWVHDIHEQFNPVFLQYSLKDRIITDYASIASGTTFAELKIFTLKSCKIFDVPLSLQNTFAAFMHRIDKLRFVIRQSLDETQKLFDSLMQEYFD